MFVYVGSLTVRLLGVHLIYLTCLADFLYLLYCKFPLHYITLHYAIHYITIDFRTILNSALQPILILLANMNMFYYSLHFESGHID